MLASLLVVLASAVGSDGGVPARQTAPGTASSLSKEDICRLVVLAASKEVVVPPHRTNLLLQPATSELAGEDGRIWMDVRMSEHGRSRYPLARGESCGDRNLVELCDWERLGSILLSRSQGPGTLACDRSVDGDR